MSDAKVIWPVGAILGEGPVWAPAENAVYFVDIKKPALHRYSLADGARKSWDMPEPIGWAIPRANKPGFIAGFKSGFATMTLDPVEIEFFAHPEKHLPGNRRNDAKVDSKGRIWAGSMDDAIVETTGALYRIDTDLSWRGMDEGYKICNGPTFCRAGKTLYHTDTAIDTIYAYTLSEDGEISNKRVFIEFEPDWGSPDGMTTDAEDHIWVAHWGGSRVSRFTPQGKLDRFIPLPASQITSCVFAGDKLDRMFVTSAAGGVDEELAGALFEVDPGVRGAPSYAFGG